MLPLVQNHACVDFLAVDNWQLRHPNQRLYLMLLSSYLLMLPSHLGGRRGQKACTMLGRYQYFLAIMGLTSSRQAAHQTDLGRLYQRLLSMVL